MTEFERNLLNRLIQDKVITEDIALVAEQMQLEKGGRIDTNLLDLRAVDEDTIIKYLEVVSKLKAVPIDKVENIRKEIISLFPARLAIRYRLIPFNVEHNTISLIINDPTDVALLEEISFLLGMDVKPYIAPDLWIEHLLSKHYKVEPNKRYEELFELIRNKGFRLKSEDAIKRDSEAIIKGRESQATKDGAHILEEGNRSKQEDKIEQSIPEEKIIDVRVIKPYTYSREEALEDIKGIKDRDAIMFYALKYAYQYFEFCAILIFQKDKIRGFNFLGSDRSIENEFKSLNLTVGSDNIFNLVRNTGAHFLGVMPMVGENEVFIRRLKRPFPPNVLIVPITIAGKVIGVFYADNGESLVRGEDVPHILTFFHIVSRELEELIRYLKFNKPKFKVIFRGESELLKPEEVLEKADVAPKTGMVLEQPSFQDGKELGIKEADVKVVSEAKVSDVIIKAEEPPPKEISVQEPKEKSHSTEQVAGEQESVLTEDMVEELSKYVDDVEAIKTQKKEGELESKKVSVKYEKVEDKDAILKKEEEYRINLLLDTLEQSPNAINSPAYDQLIAEKEKALPYIAKRFPGKLKIDLLMQSSSDISDVEEHSNLIQLIVGIGREAIPYIAPLTKSENPTIRFYAVFVFSKLRYPEAIPYLLEAIFDTSPKISLVAIEVLNRYRNFPKFSIVLSRLRSELVSNDNEKVKLAALSLGQFKDLESVPQLIKLLSSKSEEVREAALNSLRDICKEDFGLRPKEWTRWWQLHSKTPRILWMIEGLSHKDENIRYLSIEELKELTGEFFGYFYDAPKKEREKAVERWKEWWKSEGSKRFLKEGQ